MKCLYVLRISMRNSVATSTSIEAVRDEARYDTFLWRLSEGDNAWLENVAIL